MAMFQLILSLKLQPQVFIYNNVLMYTIDLFTETWIFLLIDDDYTTEHLSHMY